MCRDGTVVVSTGTGRERRPPLSAMRNWRSSFDAARYEERHMLVNLGHAISYRFSDGSPDGSLNDPCYAQSILIGTERNSHDFPHRNCYWPLACCDRRHCCTYQAKLCL